MPEFIPGQQTGYIKFGSTVLSNDFRSFNPTEDVNLVDASAGNDANRTYLTGLKDGKATAELVSQTGGSALWAALAPGTSGTLEWGPEGTVAGKQKHTVNAIVMNRERSMPYAELEVLKFDFQFSGAVVDGTY